MPKRKGENLDPGSSKRPARSTINEEEEEEDDELLELSQNPDFKPEPDSEVGIIEKITLKNFMCHNRLTIDLGSNVNFIVGSNGSGKSAVVTALVVGLGGKASATSRGTKLRSFIKTGKKRADVEIRLRNRGSDAFKPDLYGSAIIVHRTFKIDGSSTYILKTKDGKVISRNKEDLVRITDQFNIQIDNPVAVLNQDTSRNFLNSKNAHDKYKFFLKATQLDQIKEDYDHAAEQKEVSTDIIQQKIMTLPKLEKEVLHWEQKYKSLTAIDDLKRKINKLKCEIAWALVIEKEKSMHPVERDCKHEEARLPRFRQKAEEVKTKLETVQKTMDELTSQLNLSGVDVEAIKPIYEKAKNKLSEQKNVARKAQMDVRRLEGAITSVEKEKDTILERIKELQTSASQDYEVERKARLDKISGLEGDIQRHQAQESTTEHQLDQYREAVTKYNSDKHQLSQDIQMYQMKIEKLQRNLQTLRSSQGNRLKRFGAFMPQVTQRIEELARHGRFHQKPLGPLGAFFTLKDQKWALAIECCLKGLMNSFCCHDYHDEKILEQIIRDVCPGHFKPSIIVSRFKDNVYNVSQKRAMSDQYQTVLDVINCEHVMVTNTLIDQRTIECVLLIEDDREARRVMDPENRPGPPRNAREAFTPQGDQILSFPTFRYYSSNQNKARFLMANEAENMASMKAEISQHQQKQTTLTQQKNGIDANIKQNIQLERRTETQLMKIREQKRKLSQEMRELKDFEEPVPVDVASYEEEVQAIERDALAQRDMLSVKQGISSEQNARRTEMEHEFKDIEARMKEKIDTANSIKEDVGNIMNEVETCKGNKRHYDTKLKEQEKHVKELQGQLDKHKAEVEADVEKAKQLHEDRINTRRTSRNLESEITQIQLQIKCEEKQRGDPEEITRHYKEKKDAYLKIQKDVQQLKTFLEKLEEGIIRRLDQFKDFRRFMSRVAKCYFILLLNQRNYLGKMEFNHNQETLEMTVQPSKGAGQQEEGTKDMRSLSGGERSFSTVCFILSLWNTMESPFRCLDEFDIFMDMVNRRISMGMMMETAKKHKHRQYIFLSPLDMSNLGISSERMRIFKMSNPERDQTTLDFSGTRNEEEQDEEQ